MPEQPEDPASKVEMVDVIKNQHELIDEMMQYAAKFPIQDYGKLNDTLVRSAAILRAHNIKPHHFDRIKPRQSERVEASHE